MSAFEINASLLLFRVQIRLNFNFDNKLQEEPMKKDTRIINAGRSSKWTRGVVNPSVERASTVVFDSVKQMKDATAKRGEQVLFYGRRGTSTSFAFQDAMTELEGGAGCAIYPSGTAAITNAILAFVGAGDHILMVDNAYAPTSCKFCF